ncbi:MAG: HIG1 domain-containing protein [Litorimonas sp.]
MLIALYVLTGLAGLFVVFTLIAGGVSMGKKDQESRVRSNKWMQRRVLGQAVAVALLVLTLIVKTKSG